MAPSRNPAGDVRGPLVPGEILVLPEQLVTPARRKTDGVRLLMAAVLRDGIETFLASYPKATGSTRSRYQESADWLFSDDGTWPFSFVSLCDALDIDAANLRTGLLRWKAAHSHRRLAATGGRAARVRFSDAA